MATITATQITGGFKTVNETALEAGNNPIAFNASKAPVLILTNDTGSSIDAVIDGDAGGIVQCQGVGEIDVSGGLTQTVAANSAVAVKLSSVSAYLSGAVAITGTGLKAQILELA